MAVSMPSRPASTTNAATIISAVSAMPTRFHNCVSATPGMMASNASWRYSLTARCRPKVITRFCMPTMNAVIESGVRSMARAASASTRPPGRARMPLCQSTWMAVMASRLTCTVRSTGVPVRARMPTMRNGLSSCCAKLTLPRPCAMTTGSPTL